MEAEVSASLANPAPAGNALRIGVRLIVVAVALLSAVAAFAQPAKTIDPDDAMKAVKTKVDPIYPVMARNMGIEGTVEIQVTIAADGKVSKVKRESGHPVLCNAAIKAVEQWVFDLSGPATTVLSIGFEK